MLEMEMFTQIYGGLAEERQKETSERLLGRNKAKPKQLAVSSTPAKIISRRRRPHRIPSVLAEYRDRVSGAKIVAKDEDRGNDMSEKRNSDKKAAKGEDKGKTLTAKQSYQKSRLKPRIERDDKEDRFQKELERAHQDLKQKTKARTKRENDKQTSSVDISRALNSVPSTETEQLISKRLNPKKKEEGRTYLRKENSQLKRDLRRKSRFLDVERAQKVALRDRLGDLEKQITQLRVEAPNPTVIKNVSIPDETRFDDLHKQLAEYKRQLEEERQKNEQLQKELEIARRESEKYKEKMRLMVFQNTSEGPCSKFQDIGPVNANIVESEAQVGNYDLGEKLGEGHYGKVTTATNSAQKKKYAVKILDKARITRFKDLQQVAVEIHVLKNYPHPNIVHLEEVMHCPMNLYLVTELCAMDLHKYHNEFGLSEFAAQHVIFGLLKPLYHLHSHGICHLDLKPENILLSSNMDIKNVTHWDVRLCDFGLVNMVKDPKKSKDVIRTGYACGTPGFFAPEMILKNEFEGRQADMWSVGAVILEITLGFTQEWIESYDKIESDSGCFRQGLEKCLQEIAPYHYPRHQKLLDIIHLCLAIDPLKRIHSSEALVHPWLEDVINDEGRQDMVNSIRGMTDTTPMSATSPNEVRNKPMPPGIFCS